MRINHKVLSIPPYLSTSWKNISSLQSKQEGDKHSLIIQLQNGSTIEVPDLESLVIQAIFDAHAKHVELENKASKATTEEKKVKPQIKDTPTSIKFFEFENMNAMLSHNESERNSPNLPPYVLSKVESISEDMGLADSDSATLPYPEKNCNCPYCQIAKAIQKKHNTKTITPFQDDDEDDEVTEKDLSFTSWIIRPLENNFYSVIHPDSPEKEYQVFLGTPIGCTCGSSQCEHIRAVLST
jgi:hypothetical protein